MKGNSSHCSSDCNRFKYESCINTGRYFKNKKMRMKKGCSPKESPGLVVTLNLVPCNTKKYELSYFVHVDIGVTVCIQIRKSSRFNFLIMSFYSSLFRFSSFCLVIYPDFMKAANKTGGCSLLHNSLEVYLYFPRDIPSYQVSTF